MAVVLAYVDAVPGRLYPLVATLLELAQRGHRVAVRCGIDDVERLRALGLDAHSLTREIERFEPDDWKARTRFGALSSGLGQFGERAPFQLRDLEQAIENEQPDVLFVDEGAWGAAAAAEASGLPWAFSIVSPVPLPSHDAPPFGLGLRPRHDLLGRLRDRVARPLTLGTLERVIAKHMNPLRAELGLKPIKTIDDAYLAANAVIAYTAEPFEYPRADWPAKLTLVSERPAARRGRRRGARPRAIRRSRDDGRRRPDWPFRGVQRPCRAIPAAHAAARARRLRRLPRRHGHHPEGARPRRPRRRDSLRPRPARGRPPRRDRRRRREASCAETDVGAAPGGGAAGDRAPARRRADRCCLRRRRRRRGRRAGARRTPPSAASRACACAGRGA